ncbi:MAG TPA: hypothetical protein VEA92_03735 [Candidatus Paceibacterota bacterium]|nr:hypothetical protein [Candidatus Paceibacterota bacterium]
MPRALEYRFDKNNYFIQLGIDQPIVPKRIRQKADMLGYLPKPETHISVVVTSNSKALMEHVYANEDANTLANEILTLFNSFPWEYELLDIYLLQERQYRETHDRPAHIRRTIIQMVTLPDLPMFYERIVALSGANLTLPVPHVTLFSWSDYEPMMVQGIGLSSSEDLLANTRGEI